MAEAAAAKLAEEAVVGCVNQIKHHFRYLSQYHQNMTTLDTKLKNLEERRVNVRDEVFSATNNGQIIKDGVNAWLGKVDGIKEDAEKILEKKASVGSGCWKGWCANMCLRYSLSKKAMNKALDLDKFLEEGVFDPVAHPKPPLASVRADGTASTVSSERADGRLESRMLLLNDVMEAVRDPQIRMVRICGMGGVGKTTMAKEVEKMARNERLFHEVAMVEVTEKPDLKILQRHIAELFGLTITEDNLQARATWLRERLSGKGHEMERVNAPRSKEDGENKRILLILDNIWKREHLEEAGIPIEDLHSRCKILLTSRENLVCKNLEAQKEFRVDGLSGPEARTLFKISLGNSPCYDPIAEEIVKACDGLPISIKTIARALANKEEIVWIDARRRLKNSDLTREYAVVFECLKVSYDFLDNENIKKFFRLSCLFNKGSDILIEDLLRYGMALSLFNDRYKLYEARDEACSYVETLLHSNLLLRSDKEGCFKVHDHVWDFATSASSNDLFMVNHDEALTKWPRRNSYEKYTLISLHCGDTFKVPGDLDCQKLKLLQLVGDKCCLELPEKFCKGMLGLQVLAFRSMTIPSTPKSLEQLICLRSLSLHQCSPRDDVSMIKNLTKLEVLSFAHSDIKELPAEISKLKELRLLDLTGCEDLGVVAPGLLSQLTSLEELYMRGTPICYLEGNLEMFSEIASMSTLEVLNIWIPAEALPMNTLFTNLKRFKIYVGEYMRYEYEYRSENSLDLESDSTTISQPGIKSLLTKAVRMDLEITGLTTLFPLNGSEEVVFSKLKSLSLRSCTQLVNLANPVGDSFCNLKVLDVYKCHDLEHVFTLPVARGLSKLEEITIRDCEKLKVVFSKGSHGEGKVKLSNLKSLVLDELPNLIGCYDVVDAVEFPNLETMKLVELPLITSLFNHELETSTSRDTDASSHHPLFSHKDPRIVYSFQKLKSLRIISCNSLRHISTSSTMSSFGELQKLFVSGCYYLQAVVIAEGKEEEESGTKVILFPKLNHLSLYHLPRLSTILPKGYTLRWSSLKTLKVHYCGEDSDVLSSNKKSKQRGTTTGHEVLLTSLEKISILCTSSLELLRKQYLGHVFGCDDESPDLIRGISNNLKTINIEEIEPLVVLFDLEQEFIVGIGAPKVARLNKLDRITIYHLHKMTHVWKNVPKNFEGFHNLTSLGVTYCDNLKYVFSTTIAKCLVNLQLLEARYCKMIEEVVSESDEEGKNKVDDIIDFFPRLQTIHLDYLSCLIFFGPGSFGVDKLSSEALRVGSTQISHSDVNATSTSSSTLIFSEKSPRPTSSASVISERIGCSWSLHNLTELTVNRCYKMISLFPPNIQVNLRSLERLNIEECDSLEYLLCSSNTTVTSLNQLSYLRISKCKKMKEIVKHEEVDGRSKIVFPSLGSVTLERLPNLEGFCLGTLAFEWPSLISVTINFCWKMTIFTSGNSTTPRLDSLLINSRRHTITKGGGDLNATLTSVQEKDFIATTNFVLAGENLIASCPSWSWETYLSDRDINLPEGKHQDINLPEGKQYLIRKDVPCVKRQRAAFSRAVSEDNEEQTETNHGHGDDDGKNIQEPRTYDMSITCSTEDKRLPCLWLKGYDYETRMELPLELVLQDIAEFCPTNLVTLKNHPSLNLECVYLDLDLNPYFEKDLFERLTLSGSQLDIEIYFQGLLNLLFPTIQSCLP